MTYLTLIADKVVPGMVLNRHLHEMIGPFLACYALLRTVLLYIAKIIKITIDDAKNRDFVIGRTLENIEILETVSKTVNSLEEGE